MICGWREGGKIFEPELYIIYGIFKTVIKVAFIFMLRLKSHGGGREKEIFLH